MKLREIAHSRTGDKGNTSNISVIAYDARHYPLLPLDAHGNSLSSALLDLDIEPGSDDK